MQSSLTQAPQTVDTWVNLGLNKTISDGKLKRLNTEYPSTLKQFFKIGEGVQDCFSTRRSIQGQTRYGSILVTATRTPSPF